MDKPRIGFAQRKRTRADCCRVRCGSVAIAWFWPRRCLALSRRRPGVDAAVVFTDAVRRGRDGDGRCPALAPLVPETVVVIPASDAGRVERRFIQPVQSVKPGYSPAGTLQPAGRAGIPSRLRPS